MTFSQSLYSIDEDKGPVNLVLIVSNPSTTDIIVAIFRSDGSGTSKNTCMHARFMLCSAVDYITF